MGLVIFRSKDSCKVERLWFVGHKYYGRAADSPPSARLIILSHVNARENMPTQQRFRQTHARPRGQSLVEFAIILPILLALVGGIIQLGALIATKHALIQVGRDVGRWAATQDFDPLVDLSCREEAVSVDQPVDQADTIAASSGLMGYAPGTWDTGTAVLYADGTPLPPPDPAFTEGIEVVWSGDPCPTADNTATGWVTIRVSHRAPVLLPGFPYLPGIGTCSGADCYLVVRSTAQFRVEPPAVTP